MMKKLLVGSLAVGAGLAVTSKLLATTASADPIPANASFDEIDAYVQREMGRLHIPGVSLAIVDDGKIVHARGFGRARPGGETPTPQTPFFIGSLTKSVTALAVMQLVEAGKIDLDAPVQRYLHWFRVADARASAEITVRHLLNQTSGLPTIAGEIALADFDNSRDATERQARALSTQVLARPAGSKWEYSNANYNVLGLIIEAASGELYADYVQKHILTPLDMSHTYTSQAEAKRDGLAVGHRYWFGIPVAAPNTPIAHGSLPAGGLISSSEDMARYMIAILNGGRYGDVQILSGAGIDELQRGSVDVSAYGLTMGQYAMGWWVDKIGQMRLVWHSGTLPHFAGFMALLPEQKKGVILLFNACHHWMNPVLTGVGMGVAGLLAGEQPTAIPVVPMIPWMLRGQALIPAVQFAGVVATLRMLRQWCVDPESRPSGRRAWGIHILLPLIANLLPALTLKPMRGQNRGYLMLYMPDYSLISMVCGSVALSWSFLRTGLVVRALARPSSFPGQAVTKQ